SGPLRGLHGQGVAAVASSATPGRIAPEEMRVQVLPELLEAAKRISSALGNHSAGPARAHVAGRTGGALPAVPPGGTTDLKPTNALRAPPRPPIRIRRSPARRSGASRAPPARQDRSRIGRAPELPGAPAPLHPATVRPPPPRCGCRGCPLPAPGRGGRNHATRRPPPGSATRG